MRRTNADKKETCAARRTLASGFFEHSSRLWTRNSIVPKTLDPKMQCLGTVGVRLKKACSAWPPCPGTGTRRQTKALPHVARRQFEPRFPIERGLLAVSWGPLGCTRGAECNPDSFQPASLMGARSPMRSFVCRVPAVDVKAYSGPRLQASRQTPGSL